MAQTRLKTQHSVITDEEIMDQCNPSEVPPSPSSLSSCPLQTCVAPDLSVVLLGDDVTIYRQYHRSYLPFCCSRSVCFPFVWELIISAMGATWKIWRGINSCLLALPTSEGQTGIDVS